MSEDNDEVKSKVKTEKEIERLLNEKYGAPNFFYGFYSILVVIYYTLKRLVSLDTYLGIQKSQREVLMEKADQDSSIAAPASSDNQKK